MTKTKSPEDAGTRIGDLKLSEEDAHSRVAILFVVSPATESEKIVLLAISVQWLLQYGIPLSQDTHKQLAYHSTHIIQ